MFHSAFRSVFTAPLELISQPRQGYEVTVGGLIKCVSQRSFIEALIARDRSVFRNIKLCRDELCCSALAHMRAHESCFSVRRYRVSADDYCHWVLKITIIKNEIRLI